MENRGSKKRKNNESKKKAVADKNVKDHNFITTDKILYVPEAEIKEAKEFRTWAAKEITEKGYITATTGKTRRDWDMAPTNREVIQRRAGPEAHRVEVESRVKRWIHEQTAWGLYHVVGFFTRCAERGNQKLSDRFEDRAHVNKAQTTFVDGCIGSTVLRESARK